MLGSDVDRLLAAPLNWFWRRHLRGAAFINSTSHYMVHQAEKALRVPVAHLPLEIDLERFRPRDRKEARAKLEDFPENGLVALALGRWIPIKGMDFLIRLWPEVVARVPGVRLVEMERTGDKSFCCGAGGAQMWMEERLGTRVNQNRADEALGTGAEKIAVACPFCSVMLHDGVTVRTQESGDDAPLAEVVDVASLLLDSVRVPTAD